MHIFEVICFYGYVNYLKKRFWFIHKWYDHYSDSPQLMRKTWISFSKKKKKPSPNAGRKEVGGSAVTDERLDIQVKSGHW